MAEVSPELVEDRARIVSILDRYISEPFQKPRHYSCSYDGPVFPSAEQRVINDASDMQLHMQWRIRRLILKSIKAQVSALPGIPKELWDEDDDHALMELGEVP